MKIIINGEPKKIKENLSIEKLIENLGLKEKRVAVELNKTLVKQTQFAKTILNDGDCVEIVHFVGGG